MNCAKVYLFPAMADDAELSELAAARAGVNDASEA
jgi:hypothetical protein